MKNLITLIGVLGLFSTSAFAVEQTTPQAEPITRNCKIIEAVRASYPAIMMEHGVKHGTVRMILEINEKGELADSLVTAYTQKPFAEEAMRAVKWWKFEPGLVKGQPITTIINITFTFEFNGVMAIERRDGTVTLSMDVQDGFAYQARGLKNLDSIPTPIKITQPTYPQEWADQGIAGEVTADFYIDEAGKVRMSSCVSGANPQLSSIAMAAVQQWEFTPPTWRGKPVLAHARQVFHFGVKS